MEMSKKLPFNLKVLSSTESSSSLNKISSFCRSGGRSVRIGSTVTSSKILFVLFKICKQQVTIISVNISSLFDVWTELKKRDLNEDLSTTQIKYNNLRYFFLVTSIF